MDNERIEISIQIAIDNYEDVLGKLKIPTVNSCSREIIDVFIARDHLRLIIQETSELSGETLLKISQLDQNLKTLTIQRKELEDIATWRNIVSPPQEAWWWFLDACPESKSWTRRLDWLWEALTVTILVLNFSLVTAFITRFVKAGIDPLGAFAIISQSLVVALVARSILTSVGQKVIDQALENLQIPSSWHHGVKLGLAVVVFCCFLTIHGSLPSMANFYLDRGLAEQRNYRFATALENYRRATELDPNNMEAHYYLGNSYEQLQQLDEARSSYQIAVSGNVTQAFNNLGRLYIVKDQDYSAAASLLMQGLQQNIDNDQIRAIILKNLGWARLGQKRYAEAEAHLEEAIHLNELQASPHCLLAQVLEAQGKKAMALNHWRNCSDYANGQNSDEDRWFGLAQQRLNPEK